MGKDYEISRPAAGGESGEKAKIEILREWLNTAEAIVIGAGAGLSTAAGFTYGGERFRRYFADFADKYGFRDMYSGGFYPFPSEEIKWAYWSRFINLNRYSCEVGQAYKTLLELVKGRDYFVLTTNVDHQFQKAGFDKQRLFYTQGDYGLWQCGKPCHQKTYDNEETVRKMVKEQRRMLVPSELVPHCPVCGRPMTMNLRSDDTFVEDEGWHQAAGRYEEFLRRHEGMKLLFLELGVGGNTPGIIKYPFWRMTYQNPEAVYACVNYGEAFAPREIADRSICIDEDIGGVLEQIKRQNEEERI